MSLEQRLKRLEQQTHQEHVETLLYDSDGKHVKDATILRAATKERHGLARLADGTEKPIHDHTGPIVLIFSEVEGGPLPDALFLVNKGAPGFLMTGWTEDML